jgi:hypothetical protein
VTPDSGDKDRDQVAKRQDHRHEHHTWPAPTQTRTPQPSWNNTTLHHPATRIGEIKHGKA